MLAIEIFQPERSPAGQRAGPPRSFGPYAWSVLLYNLAVVLWGAYVRATGSGAGCGNRWPLCPGIGSPQSPSAATLIEFTHRATSALDAVLVALLVVWAYRAFPRRHPARLGAALSAVFLVTEALLGMSLVLLDHVARNASTARAYSLSAHLINTLTLLACLTVTAWWGSGGPAVRPRGKPAWMAAATLAAVAALGVTGAFAALGDTLYPPQSLAQGLAQDMAPSASIFLRVRLIHPVAAAAVTGWLLLYAMSTARRRTEVRRRARNMVLLAGIQMAAGAVNVVLLVPVWMQLVHLLLADLLWISLVLLCASLLEAEPA